MSQETKSKLPTARHLSIACYLIGLMLIVIVSAFYVGAGGNMVVAPHDQLDSGVDSLLLSIKHWEDGYAPELMGGVPAQNLGYGFVPTRLLFTYLPAATAYAVNSCLVMVVAYSCMYGLLFLVNVRPQASLLVSLAYAALPFYPLYGLTVMGLPLLACAAVVMRRRPTAGGFCAATALVMLYGAWSSLILAGYIVLLAFAVLALVAFLKGGASARIGFSYLALCAILLITYALTSPTLASTLSQASAAESSRVEMSLDTAPFTWDAIWSLFADGHYHARAQQKLPLWLAAGTLAIFAIVTVLVRTGIVRIADDRWMRCRKLAVAIASMLACIFLIAVFFVLYRWYPIVAFRETLPDSLRTFQFDRFYMLYPALWYTALGLAVELLLQLSESLFAKNPGRPLWPRITALVISYCLIAGCCAGTVREAARTNTVAQTIKVNYVKPWMNDSSLLTWNRYYAVDLFERIDEAIGRDKDDYRVISVGLYPVIAMHSGFHTLDGYRTTYPLEYKHEFRKIIAGELAMDEELREYFDEWGSRCYAFSHEVGLYYTIPKDSDIEIRDLRFDLDQLKKMGGDYIMSSVPILNPGQYGLRLIGEFSTDDSYYCIRVYEVE